MNQGLFVYCPYCATRLERRERFQRVRPTCPACGFIQFLDPKVAVIGMVTWHDHVLLIRRGGGADGRKLGAARRLYGRGRNA